MYPIGKLIIIIANVGVIIWRIKIKKRKKADKETQRRHEDAMLYEDMLDDKKRL